MPRLASKFQRENYAGAYRSFGLAIDRRLELAALEATDRAAKVAARSIRQAMTGAGLGRLGNGLGSASDLSSGRGIHRREAGGWSASGTVFVRSRSERTRGAIESYTSGADITPKRGRWLWIATPDLQRVAGGKGKRQRVTPGNWTTLGMDTRVGPLVLLKSIDGRPLLAVKGAGVSLTGSKGSARSLTKRGHARKGQIKRELLICFVAIPRTSRAARVNVKSILAEVQASLPRLFAEAFERTSK